jgi:2-C-methyl-D-erythritol 2,4-cyclodiphosphate synthase
MYRIGNGYDVHKMVEGRKLILGGVEIPYEKGLLGHSDADVLIHAIMDAMLGALALGDIGKHFPDTDEKYKGISSIKLLEHVYELINKKNYEIVNIDSIVVMQSPKIKGYISEMVEKVSKILNMSIEDVSIKATTEEKLGFTGNGDGVKSYAVVLMKKKGMI